MKFSSIMIGTGNIQAMIDFYTKILGEPAMKEEGNAHGWNFNGTWFTIMNHSEVKGESKEPARVIINFESEDVKGDFEKAKAAGAKVIKEPYTMEGMDGSMSTLADPDGNYIQINTPWKM
ncbi:MAG: VOC family protein [Candidatus Dojkabacteria bacterium]